MNPQVDYIVPAISVNLEDEINQIGSELVGGKLYTARSMARVARLIIEDRYHERIVDVTTGEITTFVHQDDLLRYIHRMFGMSVSNMKEHLTAYRRLIGLGMTWDESFKAVATCPGSLRMLPELASFGRDGKIVEVNPVKILALPTLNKDDMDAADGDKERVLELSTDAIRDFVGEMSDQPNARESHQMFTNVLGKNTASFSVYSDGSIVCRYTERALSDGESVEIGSGEVTWTPNAAVPQWLVEKITRRLNG